MPRRSQAGSGGLTFHVMNRGVRRLRLFDDVADYSIFAECVASALDRVAVDLFAFCIMPNHFHLVVRPEADSDLSRFMGLMTMRHSKCWHRRRQSKGGGAVYQGRFKAFPIGTERYFYSAVRYVEANPLRARLVERAEDWPWSSLAQSVRNSQILPLTEWPILKPTNWSDLVNAAQRSDEVTEIRRSVRGNLPFGGEAWRQATAIALGTANGLRRPGPRPSQEKPGVNSSN